MGKNFDSNCIFGVVPDFLINCVMVDKTCSYTELNQKETALKILKLQLIVNNFKFNNLWTVNSAMHTTSTPT